MEKKWQKTDKKRNEKILAYKKEGYSLGAIGRMFKITKQRVAQIIKKMGTVEK